MFSPGWSLTLALLRWRRHQYTAVKIDNTANSSSCHSRPRLGIRNLITPTAAAAMLGAWPFDIWVAGTILVTGTAIACLSMLRCAMRARRHLLPALH